MRDQEVVSAERRLATAQEAASALMSIVANELRSPLASIKAYAETLGGNLDNPRAPRERFLGIIDEECDRLASLVTDVHDLSRLESGECTLRLSTLSLAEFGREAWHGGIKEPASPQLRAAIEDQRARLMAVNFASPDGIRIMEESSIAS